MGKGDNCRIHIVLIQLAGFDLINPVKLGSFKQRLCQRVEGRRFVAEPISLSLGSPVTLGEKCLLI
jgi:hypothetical protein